jgi:hypothetical protein
MGDRVILTEKREAVLNGNFPDLSDDYDDPDAALRNQKSRLRESSRTALEELIVVAASPEIENADVFEPNTLARLVDALMVPNGKALTPRWNFDGDPTEYRDEYQYQLGLQSRLDHALDGYQEMLHRDYPPGEQPNLLDGTRFDADDL